MAKKPKTQTKKPDDLSKTNEKKDIELKEDDLGQVTGGAFDTYMQFQDYKGKQ